MTNGYFKQTIRGIDKTYFYGMLKSELLRDLEQKQDLVHDQLLTNDAHTNDPEYSNYLKQQYLSYTDLIHYIAKFGFDKNG